MSRTYTPEQKAQAIAAVKANRGLVNRTSKQLGIPRKTLDQWVKGTVGVKEVTPELVAEKENELADKLEKLAHILIDAIPGKVEKANLSQTAVAAGIAIDKRALLKGQPTSITESRSDKARYETAIKQMQEEMEKLGQKIDRKEAIEYLKPHLPDISEFVN